jgi:hypothetical protein
MPSQVGGLLAGLTDLGVQTQVGDELVGAGKAGEISDGGHDRRRRADFGEATFENWESEFLQMGLYVLSRPGWSRRARAESKPEPVSPGSTSIARCTATNPQAPWPVRRVAGCSASASAHAASPCSPVCAGLRQPRRRGRTRVQPRAGFRRRTHRLAAGLPVQNPTSGSNTAELAVRAPRRRHPGRPQRVRPATRFSRVEARPRTSRDLGLSFCPVASARVRSTDPPRPSRGRAAPRVRHRARGWLCHVGEVSAEREAG